ncbi:hypothetical protein [Arcobacter cloacae]|uniref:Uncharacterized protein n=1 Tax=Arcobacter cloacae TaxID=1054034 RepID=A0A6M8NVE6_9BACT|nr:hypothetical protein [Arcobacter cloacae]QKF90586.1 hypothetical protein ACLO_2121 [Arcobacter cloacae]RXI37595.1 hypothetical protein CP963_12325 [Arcobacter cloacae]
MYHSDTKQILQKRFDKLSKHYEALRDYKSLINNLLLEKDIYEQFIFNTLKAEEKAILDAYLKRFSSIQDFLGAKIFPLLLDVAGINSSKMSEVLYYIEKEEIIDSLENWIELREIRNELEHDYPEELKEALIDLKFCIDSFQKIESYYFNSLNFAKKYIK